MLAVAIKIGSENTKSRTIELLGNLSLRSGKINGQNVARRKAVPIIANDITRQNLKNDGPK